MPLNRYEVTNKDGKVGKWVHGEGVNGGLLVVQGHAGQIHAAGWVVQVRDKEHTTG